MADQYVFGREAVLQIEKVVREYLGRRREYRPQYKRSAAGTGCKAQNCKLQLAVLGGPTGGTFDIDLTVNDSEETLTFNYDDTAAEVKTELETHTEIAVDDVTVTGGPFPDATIEIEFVENLAKTNIAIPVADWASLTGGTGVGVIPSSTQLGYPK